MKPGKHASGRARAVRAGGRLGASHTPSGAGPGCGGGAPAVEAHGCAAFDSAVGPAPVASQAAPRAILGNPLLACPDGQVLPQAKEADHTETEQGEGMSASSPHQEFRIMHIMSRLGYYGRALRDWLAHCLQRPRPASDVLEARACL